MTRALLDQQGGCCSTAPRDGAGQGRWLVLALVVGCAGFSGCAATLPESDCRTDAQCAGAAVCDGSRCMDPAALATPSLLESERVVLRPLDDAVVAQGQASRVLGATDFLLMGSGRGTSAWRTYMRFDLGALPRSSGIRRAELRLRTRTDPPGLPAAPCVLGVYLVGAPWRGQRLTWDNQPGATGDERAWTTVPGATDTEVRIDVTAVVADLTRGVSANHGFVLRARDEGADARIVAYSSRSPVPTVRPWLEVLYR